MNDDCLHFELYPDQLGEKEGAEEDLVLFSQQISLTLAEHVIKSRHWSIMNTDISHGNEEGQIWCIFISSLRANIGMINMMLLPVLFLVIL